MSISREQGGSACHFYDLVSEVTSTLSTGQSSDRRSPQVQGKETQTLPLDGGGGGGRVQEELMGWETWFHLFFKNTIFGASPVAQ